MAVHVAVSCDNPVVVFAAKELQTYLTRMLNGEQARDCTFELGLADAYSRIPLPPVPDPSVDDRFHIQCEAAGGVIAGGNPRSVLLAVYRYLTEQGCRWVRPGDDGEYVPRLSRLREVNVTEAASYRHRAVCIEGAVSYEHVRDMIAWLPKVGFNGYFIQFREAHTFFNRWYAREENPFVVGERLSVEKAAELTTALESEITKRGLLYHKVGHGWTCEPFGIKGLGWERETVEPAKEIVPYLAMVNGERKLWGGIALNTNLCYSNPEVRRIMATAIADYAETHRDIDYLHVWLADGSNNNCECAACQKARPSDFYVQMLNEADAELTRRRLSTRIVFLIYVDLLWPPEKERFVHPERFVLMFAPIARTYSESFRSDENLPPLPPYHRNRLEFPRDVRSNLAFLRAWQEIFQGDSFDFDYHLMWDHLSDPGHMQISRTIGADMKALRDIGLNGFVSCQVQRLFLPTGLPMTVMARTLWNRTADIESVTNDYFASAFGPDGTACRTYLERLSALFDPPYLRGERPEGDKDAAKNLTAVPEHIRAFQPVIEKNCSLSEPSWARSWQYLRHHAEITSALAQSLAAKASGDAEQAQALWAKTLELVWRKEPEIHPVLDCWLFANTLRRKFVKE